MVTLSTGSGSGPVGLSSTSVSCTRVPKWSGKLVETTTPSPRATARHTSFGSPPSSSSQRPNSGLAK